MGDRSHRHLHRLDLSEITQMPVGHGHTRIHTQRRSDEALAPADEFERHAVQHGLQGMAALVARGVRERMSANVALSGNQGFVAGQADAATGLAVVDLVDVREFAGLAAGEHDHAVVARAQGDFLVQIEEGADVTHDS